jgi:hemoglobin
MTPYERAGGAEAVARLVDRFYDLMDGDPSYAELRAMHAPDLGPMRRSLTGFLTGWLGGPREWFDDHPGKCMMSLHAPLPIDQRTAGQWTQAMGVALREVMSDAELADQIDTAFHAMATGMARR